MPEKDGLQYVGGPNICALLTWEDVATLNIAFEVANRPDDPRRPTTSTADCLTFLRGDLNHLSWPPVFHNAIQAADAILYRRLATMGLVPAATITPASFLADQTLGFRSVTCLDGHVPVTFPNSVWHGVHPFSCVGPNILFVPNPWFDWGTILNPYVGEEVDYGCPPGCHSVPFPNDPTLARLLEDEIIRPAITHCNEEVGPDADGWPACFVETFRSICLRSLDFRELASRFQESALTDFAEQTHSPEPTDAEEARSWHRFGARVPPIIGNLMVCFCEDDSLNLPELCPRDCGPPIVLDRVFRGFHVRHLFTALIVRAIDDDNVAFQDWTLETWVAHDRSESEGLRLLDPALRGLDTEIARLVAAGDPTAEARIARRNALWLARFPGLVRHAFEGTLPEFQIYANRLTAASIMKYGGRTKDASGLVGALWRGPPDVGVLEICQCPGDPPFPSDVSRS